MLYRYISRLPTEDSLDQTVTGRVARVKHLGYCMGDQYGTVKSNDWIGLLAIEIAKKI